MPEPIDGEPTAGQLARYLFGNPLDPRDEGIIGRMDRELRETRKEFQEGFKSMREDWRVEAASVRKLVGRMLALGWAILIVLLGATASLIVALLIGKIP